MGGAALLCGVMEALREEGKTIPWRLTVCFAAPPPYQESPLEAPFPTSTIFAWGDQDPWYQKHFIRTWDKVFTNPVHLEYGDAHEFPTKEPQATDVYSRVISEIRRHCGLLEE